MRTEPLSASRFFVSKCKAFAVMASALGFTTAAHASSAQWTGTATTSWTTPTNWNTNPTIAGSPLGSTTNTDTATFNGQTGVQSVTVDSGRNLQNFVFNPGTLSTTYTFTGGPLVLTAGGSMTVNTGGTSTVAAASFTTPITLEGNYSFISNGTSATNFAGGAQSYNSLAFSGAFTIDPAVTSPTTLTLGGTNGAGVLLQYFIGGGNFITGKLSDGTSSKLSIVKTGTGTWVLAGQNANSANNYTGTTTIDGGVLNVGNLTNEGTTGGVASSIGASSGLASNLVFGNGELQYTGWVNVTSSGSANSQTTDRLFTIGDASTNGSSASATIDSSDYAMTSIGAATHVPVSLTFSNTGAVSLGTASSYNLTLSGINVSNNVFAPSLGNNGTALSSLTKAGQGTWVITNSANSYSGATTVTGGVLRDGAASGSALPTASLLDVNGGVWETDNNISRTLGNVSGDVEVLAGGSGFSAFGANPLSVTIANSGPLQWGSGLFNPTFFILNQTTATNNLTLQDSIDLSGGNRVIDVNAKTATITGSISNSSATPALLAKGGNGTLVLGASGSYNGGTLVSGGVLSATATGALGTGNVSVINNAELQISALNDLSGGKVTLNNGILGAAYNTSTADLSSIVTSGSTGGIAIDSNQSNALNMAAIGNGHMALGASTGFTGIYSASSLGISGRGTAYAGGTSPVSFGGTYLLGDGGGTLIFTQDVMVDQALQLFLQNPTNEIMSLPTDIPFYSAISNTSNSVVIGDSSTNGQTNGGGTVVLQATQSYTGTTTVNAGSTLTLDYSALGAATPGGTFGNVIQGNNPVILAGGNLTLNGASGTIDTQTLGGLDTSLGTSIISAIANGATSATLNLGTISASRGSTTEFVQTGATASFTAANTSLVGPETSGMSSYGLGQFVYNDGTSVGWAGTSTANPGPYTLAKLTGETTLTAAATSATNDYVMTAPVTPTQSEALNLLRITNTAAATLTMGAHVLTLNGILFNGTANGAVSGTAGSDGITSTNGVVYIQNYGAAGTTFNIADPIIGSGVSLVYAGTGITLQTVANTNTGFDYLDGGTLQVSPGNLLGTTTLVINGGTLLSTVTGSGEVYGTTIWAGNFTLGAYGALPPGTIENSIGSATNSVTLTNNITLTMLTNGQGGWGVAGSIGDGGYGYGITIGANSSSAGIPAGSGDVPFSLGSTVANTFTGAINILATGLNLGGTNSTNRFNTINLAANTTLNISGANGAGGTYFIAGLNDAGLPSSTETVLEAGSNASTLTFNGTGNYSFGGTITNNLANTKVMNLTIDGPGTQTLTGANTTTGTITLSGGKLIVDASQGGSFTGTNTAVFSGGTYELKNTSSGTAATQTFAAVGAFGVGGSNLIVDNNGNSNAATMNFGTLGTPATLGGVLDVQALGTTTPNIKFGTTYLNTTAGSHVVFTTGTAGNTTTTWMTNSGVNTASSAYTAETALTTAATTSTVNYVMTGNLSGSIGTETLNLLRITGGTALTQTGGTTLSLNGGGLLYTGSSAFDISGGSLKEVASAKDLVIQNYGTAPLEIDSQILDAGTSALTLAGPGTTILTASNSYGGATFFDGGVTKFNQLSNFGTGTAMTFAGGTLQYAAGNSADITARNITITAAGGTIDSNGNAVTFNGLSSGNAIGNGIGGLTFIDTSATPGSFNINGSTTYTGLTTIGSGAHVNLSSTGNFNSAVAGTLTETVIASGGTLTGGTTQALSSPVSAISANAGKILLMAGGVLSPGSLAPGQVFSVGTGNNSQSVITPGIGNQNDGTGAGTAPSNNVLNATNLTWNANSTIKFTLDSTTVAAGNSGTAFNPSGSTVLNLGSGALVKSGAGTFTLDFQNTGTYDMTDYAPNVYDLINFGATSPTGGPNGDTNFNINDFTIVNLDGIGTLSFFLNTNGNGTGQEELLLTVIPEPSTYAMLLGGLVMLIFWSRRRSRFAKS